jgi:hypothetical protein
MNEVLILFYNRMWGMPLDFQELRLPEGCYLTGDKGRFEQADAVVFHLPQARGIEQLSKPRRQIWVAWSMECEVHYPWMSDPDFLQLFDLTMTYRRDSDVPVPYYDLNLIPALRSLPKPKSKDKLTALFLSGSHDRSGRVRLVRAMMQYLDVHSYGSLLRNRQLQDDRGRETKLEALSGYKFTLAFENAIARDYVTEKFFDPLIAGSVPVYLGAPNVKDFAPGEKCFIPVTDFRSAQDLTAYLLALNEDEAAYQAYHAWREGPLRPEFVHMLEAVGEHPFVRLSRKVLEIKSSPRKSFWNRAR